jgi:hypothetical protein
VSTSVTLNGSTYSIPAVGEDGWGTEVSNYLIALSTGVLQKAGGAFTLTAEVDFGATYGLKSTYFKSRTSNAASAGPIRLANNEAINWRNAANSADLGLKVNASNILEYNGNPLLTLALGSGDTALVMNAGGTAYSWSKIVNANIDTAAAIALSKLAAVTASRALVSDGSGVISASAVTATELGYVSGVTSAIQTQIDAKQALDATLTALAAYSTDGLVTQTAADTFTGRTLTAGSTKLSVTNGNGVAGNPTVDLGTVTGSTGIVAQTGASSYSARTITATNTAGTALSATNGDGVSGNPTVDFNPANITIAQIGASPLTTKGDLLTYSSAAARLAVGTDGQVLTADSAETTGLKWTSPLTNPMDSEGDLIVGGASGAATKLDHGTKGKRLTSGGAATPIWGWQSVRTGTDAYTVTNTDGYDVLELTGTTNRTHTLPDAASNAGRVLSFINSATSSATLTIARAGSDTIGGLAATSIVLYNTGDSLTLVAVGATWQILSFPEKQTSEIWVSGGTAYGSSDLAAMKYTTTNRQVGSDISYTDSASSGAVFTINSAGIYSMSLSANFNAAAGFGIVRNGSTAALDGGPYAATVTANEIIAAGFVTSNGICQNCAATVRLSAGDVIQCLGDTTTRVDTRVAGNQFRICKISD